MSPTERSPLIRSLLPLVAPAAALLASPSCDSHVNAIVCAPGQSEACYSGAGNSEGVGLCKGGARTCDAQGSGWSACEGEVVPAAEACDGADNNCDGQVDEGDPGGGGACITGEPGVCAAGALVCSGGTLACTATTAHSVEKCDTAADDNCDGLGPCDGKHLWSLSAGGKLTEEGLGVAADSAGNALVALYFDSAVDLGGGPVQSEGATDALVAKIDPAGKLVWSKHFGGTLYQGVLAVAADHMMNVVAIGSFEGAMSFGGDSELQSQGLLDVFVAKLDAAGAPLWFKRFGDASGEQGGNDVAVDGTGNLLLVGSFEGSIDFGGGSLQSAGGTDMFVAKLDPGGGALWSRSFGALGQQGASSVAIDAKGNAVITGSFTGSIDFGEGEFVSAGQGDVFVVKLDPAGNTLWSRRFGGTEWDVGYAVAVDSAGNATVVGRFSGTADFGNGLLTGVGNPDAVNIFVVRLDTEGSTIWSTHLDEPWADGYGVAVDGADNALVTGNFSQDVGIVKLDTSGNSVWSKRFGSTGWVSARGRGIAVDALGYVLVTGSFQESMDVEGTLLTSNGESDFLLSRFAP